MNADAFSRSPANREVFSRTSPQGSDPGPEEFVSDWTEIWGNRLGSAWAFQDTARTTPATAIGNPIGSATGWLNGIHLEQGTAGARPLVAAGLQGFRAWQLDGVNDYLRSQISSTINSVGGGWFGYIVVKTMGTSGRLFTAMDSDVIGNDYDKQNGFNVSWIGGGNMRMERLLGSAIASPTPATNAYVAFEVDDNAGNFTVYAAGTSATTVAAKGGFAPDRVFVGAGVSGGVTFYDNQVGVEVGILNRTPTASERSRVISWIRSFWGVS